MKAQKTNKKGKKKQSFNIYSAFNKNKKGIVAGISLFLAFLMLLGVQVNLLIKVRTGIEAYRGGGLWQLTKRKSLKLV